MKYVNYILDAEEPIKMGDQGSQANSDALSYIAGSAIRGAVISECVKAGMYVEELVKNTRFYDAYIVDGERHAVPVPLVYYADKHSIRENELRLQSDLNTELEISTCLDHSPKEGEQRVDADGYGIFESNGKLDSVRVRKIANLHIKVGSTSSDKAMYRYEAIEENQSFGGTIACEDDETAENYRNLIEGKTLYLGGSKGSGYGRCRVRSVEIVSYEQVINQYGIDRKEDNGTLVVYALSNILQIDDFGEVSSEIPEDYLKKSLGITNVKLKKSFVSIGVSGGFNHTWRAGSVQRSLVKAGSVFVYIYDGKLNEAAILQLEEKGIGMRRQDGFGRILINPDLVRVKRISHEIAKRGGKLPLTDDDQKVLALIEREVYDRRYRKTIEELALKYSKTNKGLVAKFSLAQISHLYGLLSELAAFDVSDDVIKKRVTEYSNGIYNRTTVTGEIDRKTSKTVEAYDTAMIKLPNGDGTEREITMSLLLDDLVRDSLPWGAICVPKVELASGDIRIAESALKTKVCLVSAILYNLMRKEGGKKR